LIAEVAVTQIGVNRQDGLAQIDRCIDADSRFAIPLVSSAVHPEISRFDRFGIEVHPAEAGKNLRTRRKPARRVAGDADFGQCGSDRAPDRPFDIGQSFVLELERLNRDLDRGFPVDTMGDIGGRLDARILGIAVELPEIEDVPPRLVDARPIPCLARWNVLLPDVDGFGAGADLPLWTVEDDVDLVVAVQKLNVVKQIALAFARPGEAEKDAVSIDFGIPSGRQVTFESGSIEGGWRV
jgi:hypothetical protein